MTTPAERTVRAAGLSPHRTLTEMTSRPTLPALAAGATGMEVPTVAGTYRVTDLRTTGVRCHTATAGTREIVPLMVQEDDGRCVAICEARDSYVDADTVTFTVAVHQDGPGQWVTYQFPAARRAVRDRQLDGMKVLEPFFLAGPAGMAVLAGVLAPGEDLSAPGSRQVADSTWVPLHDALAVAAAALTP